jgi:hypothetical protein
MGEPLDFQELISCHSSPTGPHPIFKDGPVVGVDKGEHARSELDCSTLHLVFISRAIADSLLTDVFSLFQVCPQS